MATTHSFLDAARALRTDVRLHTEVRQLTVSGSRVVGVQTDRGSIETRTVVVAGGAWVLPLLRESGIDVRLTPVRVQVALYASAAIGRTTSGALTASTTCGLGPKDPIGAARWSALPVGGRC